MAERAVDAYVAALPADQREIAEAVRGLVKAAAPNAKESIKWAQPVCEDNCPFAYLRAFRNHVNFGFWRGVEVDAGRGLLETSASVMAHVKLRSAGGHRPCRADRDGQEGRAAEQGAR